MNFKERDFIPMLFGGDINTYSVARAFYERYKVKSYTFGKFARAELLNIHQTRRLTQMKFL